MSLAIITKSQAGSLDSYIPIIIGIEGLNMTYWKYTESKKKLYITNGIQNNNYKLTQINNKDIVVDNDSRIVIRALLKTKLLNNLHAFLAYPGEMRVYNSIRLFPNIHRIKDKCEEISKVLTKSRK